MQRSINYHLYLAFFFIVLSSGLPVKAQTTDSLIVVNAKWQKTKLRKGVVWYKGHFDQLFSSVQEINWVEIDLNKAKNKVNFAADAKVLKPTSVFAQENHALVAINGGFFDMKNGGAVDLIKIDGHVINPTSSPSERANALLNIRGQEVFISQPDEASLSSENIISQMLSGPMLLENGVRVQQSKNPFNDNRHPRTAIAMKKNNKLVFLVVDGRNAMAQGMSIPELANLLKWIGAETAMNLDGGGSSTLFIQGATANNIVNYPSDNKKFDHEGERPVANIVFIK